MILGTVAFTDPDLLGEALAAHGPERILVGVDVRGGLRRHPWLAARTRRRPARDAFAELRERGARHFVFTNIDHDGMLDGANREEVAWVARAAGEAGEGSVIVSGGIGSREDLEALGEPAPGAGARRARGRDRRHRPVREALHRRRSEGGPCG